MADLAKGRHTATRFALGAALGVLVFLAVYGVSPLDVANDAFAAAAILKRTSNSTTPGGCSTAKTQLVFPSA